MITPWNYANEDSDEHKHQVALFMWCRMAQKFGFDAAWNQEWWAIHATKRNYWKGYPVSELSLLFAIPNGGHRNIREAARLKAEGVKAGVSDLFLPVPCGHWHGLWIELKKPKNSRASDEQKEWISAMQKLNYAASVCYGWQEAARTIQLYLESGPFVDINDKSDKS